MSVKVMSWVWEHSLSRGSDRLVLLAIADCASEDGSNAYPSMAELVRKTGLSERSVQYSIRDLVKLGELFVNANGGPRGCNRYRVVMTEGVQTLHPADSAPRTDCTTPQDLHPATVAPPQGLHLTSATVAPGTVLEPSKISSSKRSTRKPEQPRADVAEICSYLADKIEENGSKRPNVSERWRTEARLLLDNDGRTVEQVKRAIDWCQSDAFWRANVLSMPTLRKQYERLRLAAQRGSPPTKHQPYRNPTDPNAYSEGL